MTRLREIHLQMVDAVLSGEGLGRVAQLASGAAGGPVAILVPRLAVAVAHPEDADIGPLRRYATDRVKDRPSPLPERLVAEAPITSGDDVIGIVALLAGPGEPSPDAAEFLHLAAVAALTEVAVEEAKEEVEQNLRGSLLEELRSRPDLDPREVVRRAGRLGCDLSRGAVILCAELTTDRPRHVVATIAGEHPGALAQHMDDQRVYALLPAIGGDDAPERTLDAARRLATRLQRHGTVGVSSFYADPADLSRAIQEAELVLDVLRQSDAPIAEDIGTGTYRLLFRVLASHPEEVRSFYEDTVAPIVRYDDQYRTDLVGTLEAYLEQNCNMNATAATIYAHRHTVAYRLDRVKELTGLDPMQSEDRERLGLGLKAYRIIAPRLPR
ncbi:MAG: helix-turn-helix domain-containing protein [Solirubrobacteraceae bacterium]|nr:helix-turn-helix domain-containing protein [Solirubrobacteraceae bacterium]